MIACVVVAMCFLLAGGAIWLADFIGPELSCASFAGAFLILALGFWLFGRAKSNAADQDIDAAKQTVTNTVRAASNTVEALTSKATSSVGSVDVILGGALLALLLYLGSRAGENRSRDFPSR
jgi:thiol:disulfide interchange protein